MSIAIMSGKFKSEEQKSKVFSLIQQASRIMDLFQHHDAITGTEKDFVVKDYADRLVKAVNMIHQAYAAVMNINSGEADINIDILTEKVSERGRLPVTKVNIPFNPCTEPL
jgi:alpha-mannosidase II